jgi:DNA-binding transcriptional regulator PaaX
MPFIRNSSEDLTSLLLATIGSARNTRKFRSILFEQRLKKYKKESVRVTFSRLQEKEYIEKSTFGWSVTNNGKTYLKEKNRQRLLSYLISPFKKNQTPSIIISFDIPEKNRKVRNWLRNQIKIFGYKMLQQSLWIGPGPLPKEFLRRLEDLKIRKNVKTFKIRT